jgi:hypothetical protein
MSKEELFEKKSVEEEEREPIWLKAKGVSVCNVV